MRFAMLELLTVLTTLTQKVDCELLSDPDLDMAITLRPSEDIRMRVHKR